jgi:hypothetical protein
MHPLMESLKGFSDSQLENKLYTLNRAYWVTNNTEVRQQMLLIMDSLKLEMEERRSAASRGSNDLDNDLDKLINIS